MYVYTHFYPCTHTHTGINETVDVLTAVNSSTMALSMSFMALQKSLNTTSTQVSMLITDCENQGTVQSLCDMIPRPQQFQTQADFANVSQHNTLILNWVIEH